MRAGPDTVVTLSYTLQTPGGQVVDTTLGLGPVTMLFNQTQVIPGLHQALVGLAAGGDFGLDLAPEMAFGRRAPAMIRQLPRSRFPADASMYVGAQLVIQTERPSGFTTMYVTAIDGDTVTVDLHHPLAGLTLRLEGTLNAVRKATEQELTEGMSPSFELDPDEDPDEDPEGDRA